MFSLYRKILLHPRRGLCHRRSFPGKDPFLELSLREGLQQSRQFLVRCLLCGRRVGICPRGAGPVFLIELQRTGICLILLPCPNEVFHGFHLVRERGFVPREPAGQDIEHHRRPGRLSPLLLGLAQRRQKEFPPASSLLDRGIGTQAFRGKIHPGAGSQRQNGFLERFELPAGKGRVGQGRCQFLDRPFRIPLVVAKPPEHVPGDGGRVGTGNPGGRLVELLRLDQLARENRVVSQANGKVACQGGRGEFRKKFPCCGQCIRRPDRHFQGSPDIEPLLAFSSGCATVFKPRKDLRDDFPVRLAWRTAGVRFPAAFPLEKGGTDICGDIRLVVRRDFLFGKVGYGFIQQGTGTR